jgi:hypothetical protein
MQNLQDFCKITESPSKDLKTNVSSSIFILSPRFLNDNFLICRSRDHSNTKSEIRMRTSRNKEDDEEEKKKENSRRAT